VVFYDRRTTVRLLRALLEDLSPAIPGLCLYDPGHCHVPLPLRVFIDDLSITHGAS
jgi:hypothetical protein